MRRGLPIVGGSISRERVPEAPARTLSCSLVAFASDPSEPAERLAEAFLRASVAAGLQAAALVDATCSNLGSLPQRLRDAGAQGVEVIALGDQDSVRVSTVEEKYPVLVGVGASIPLWYVCTVAVWIGRPAVHVRTNVHRAASCCEVRLDKPRRGFAESLGRRMAAVHSRVANQR